MTMERQRAGELFETTTLKKVLRGASFALGAFICAQAGFAGGMNPFGGALLCAVTARAGGADIVCTIGGLLGGAAVSGAGGGVYAITYALMFAARFVCSALLMPRGPTAREDVAGGGRAARTRKRTAKRKALSGSALARRSATLDTVKDAPKGAVKVAHEDAAKGSSKGASPARTSRAAGAVKAVFRFISAAAGRVRSAVGDGAVFFREPLAARCVVSTCGALFAGFVRTAASGFLYYDIFASILSAAVSPAMCALYDGAVGAGRIAAVGCVDGRRRVPARWELRRAGALALAFTGVYAMRGSTFFGFEVAFLVAAFLTMAAAERWGATTGGIAGLVLGAAAGLSHSPALGAAGLAAGALAGLSPTAAVAAGGIVAAGISIVSDGFGALGGAVPLAAIAATTAVPAVKLGFTARVESFFGFKAGARSDAVSLDYTFERERADEALRRASGLADAYEAMSKTFFDLSRHLRRPELNETAQLVRDACMGRCGACPQNKACLVDDRDSVEDALAHVTLELHANGRVGADAVPEWLAARCWHMPRILDDINETYAKIAWERIRNDKTEVFAIDYEGTARLLHDMCDRLRADCAPDPEATDRLRRRLRYMDIDADAVAVSGGRIKRVLAAGVDLSGVRMGADDLRRALSNVVGMPLTPPTFTIEGDRVDMSAVSLPLFTARCAVRTRASERGAEGEGGDDANINGDTASYFSSDDGRTYCLLSDGMGTGREAALTSRVCALYLERMLVGGARTSVALELLASFLRCRCSECSATVDLCELDLRSGIASFVKSGAAPSFLVRGGSVFRIQSKTAPIGILRALDAEKTELALQDGDLIVMVSDGVAVSYDDTAMQDAALVCMLADLPPRATPEEVADAVIAWARSADDKSVLAVRIRTAPDTLIE